MNGGVVGSKPIWSEDAPKYASETVFPTAVAVAECIPANSGNVSGHEKNSTGPSLSPALKLDQECLEPAFMSSIRVLPEKKGNFSLGKEINHGCLQICG